MSPPRAKRRVAFLNARIQNGSGITDTGVKQFVDLLATGTLDKFQMLNIRNNSICDAGIEALADSVSKGTLHKL